MAVKYFLGLAVGVVAAGAVLLSFLTVDDETHEKPAPAVIEAIEGSEVKRVTLIPSAAERLDIQTDSVRRSDSGTLVVPSAALIITPDGRFWVYSSPEPLVYERRELLEVVEIDYQVHFADGPPESTNVVITGVPELYGAEFGIGK